MNVVDGFLTSFKINYLQHSVNLKRYTGVRHVRIISALTAVLRVGLSASVSSEAHTRTAGLYRTIFSLSSHLPLIVDSIELQNGQLHRLMLTVSLLGLGVHLLLSLLSTSTQTEHQVQGGLLLDIVVTKSAPVL